MTRLRASGSKDAASVSASRIGRNVVLDDKLEPAAGGHLNLPFKGWSKRDVCRRIASRGVKVDVRVDRSIVEVEAQRTVRGERFDFEPHFGAGVGKVRLRGTQGNVGSQRARL